MPWGERTARSSATLCCRNSRYKSAEEITTAVRQASVIPTYLRILLMNRHLAGKDIHSSIHLYGGANAQFLCSSDTCRNHVEFARADPWLGRQNTAEVIRSKHGFARVYAAVKATRTIYSQKLTITVARSHGVWYK